VDRVFLAEGGPDALHVVVVLDGVQELADLGALLVVEFRILLRDVAHLGGDHGPAVALQPGGDGVDGGEVAKETGAGRALGRDVVVLGVGEGGEIVRPGLDRGGLEVGPGDGRVRLDDADVVEKKLVRAGGAEDALLEEHAHLGGEALHVVGVALDDDRHLVRRVALEGDGGEVGLFAAGAGALVDGALDHVARDGGLLGLFDGGEEPGVGGEVAAAELRGDGDFLHQLADDLALLVVNDRAFRVQPLASHKRSGCEVWKNAWRRKTRGSGSFASAGQNRLEVRRLLFARHHDDLDGLKAGFLEKAVQGVLLKAEPDVRVEVARAFEIVLFQVEHEQLPSRAKNAEGLRHRGGTRF